MICIYIFLPEVDLIPQVMLLLL